MANEQELICPFCDEPGFDAVGLKGHLTYWCEVYASTLLHAPPMFGGREVSHEPAQKAQGAPVDQPERCAECDACARHAYSDATTPGFFFDKCERHRRVDQP